MTTELLWLALVLAVLPALGLAYLIYRADHYAPENRRPLLWSLALGALLVAPALWIEGEWLDAWRSPGGWWATMLLSFVILAMTEETLKLMALLGYPYRRTFFDEPMDGIVYAAMIGMGFALAENTYYAWQFGWRTVLMRALTAVPAHAIFAVFMGYFVGRARFEAGRSRLLSRAWLVAITLHGVYNFLFLQRAFTWLLSLVAPLLIVSAYLAYDLIRRQQRDSLLRHGEKEES